MKNNFDIGITTFSLRFNFIESLIKQIRNLNIENNIVLCINGEKDGLFDEEYRKKILNLCSNNKNVYPIFFIETRGLSKMWNTLLVHSSKNDMLILNDDISITSNNIFEVTSAHVEAQEYFGLTKINDTFSFFIANRNFIDSLGYFDERLIGFGEEDGDIMHRLKSDKGKDIYRLNVSGVENIVSDIRHQYVKPGIGKYSLFNRNYMFKQKYKCDGDIYFFPEGIKCIKVMEDIQLYPYERFFHTNKHLL